MVDALSQPYDFGDSQLFILSMPQFQFLEELHKTLQTSSEFVRIFKDVQSNLDAHEHYSIHQQLLLYKGKIWLNNDNPFIHVLLEEFHKTPLNGHTRVAKTLLRLQHNFYWHGMHDDVQKFMAQCVTCLQTK